MVSSIRCRVQCAFNLQEDLAMADTRLATLLIDTPQQGFELAITLSRRGEK